MVLTNLNLLQQWLTEYFNRNSFKVFENIDKMPYHQFSDLNFPIEFYQEESQCFVDSWSETVPAFCERF